MALPGVKSTNISDRIAVSDTLIVNGMGSTGLQRFDDLALQLAASGPISGLGNVRLIYETRAQIIDAPAPETGTGAWVVNDPIAALNGIYRYIGTGWKRVADLPYSFIRAADDGTGSVNAIKASSSLPITDSALIVVKINSTNTDSHVTIAFNDDAPLVVRTASDANVTPGGLPAGTILLGFRNSGFFRLLSDQASAAILAAANAAKDAAIAARDLAAGFAADIVAQGNVPIYGTRNGLEALIIPAGTNTIRTNGFHGAGLGGAGVYRRVDSEPAHSRKVRSADRYMPSGIVNATHGGWWELVVGKDGINLLQLGAILTSLISVMPTYDAKDAFAKAHEFTGVVNVPAGEFTVDPQVNFNSTKICGLSRDLTKFVATAVSNAPTFWGLSSNIAYSGFTMQIDPAAIGEHDGLYSTGITIGRYFHAAAYPSIRGVLIHDVVVIRPAGALLKVNSFTVIGDVADVTFTDCKVVGGLGGIVCHWGAREVSTYGLPITQTFHPHNILIENFEAEGTESWGIFISACYNVTVRNYRFKDCMMSFCAVPGDVGNRFATAAEKKLILSGINVDGCYGNLIPSTTILGASPIMWRGTGNYEGYWVRTPYKNCSMKNVFVSTVGITTAAAVFWVRDAAGIAASLDIENVHILTDSAQTKAYDFSFSTGVRTSSLKTNAFNGGSVTACKDIKLDVSFGDPVATTTATSNAGLAISGARYTKTLTAAIAVGATSLSFDSGMPIRLFAGDIIRHSSDPSKYAVIMDDYVPTSATTLTIAPTTWSASSGDSFYVDWQVEADISGRLDGYPTLIAGRSTTSRHISRLAVRGVEFLRGGRYDLSISNAQFLTIKGCRFAKGGTRYAALAQASACIDLEAVGGYRITENDLGTDSLHYYRAINYRDGNCYNGAVNDNFIGPTVIAPISGVAQSGSYASPDRTNRHENNRLMSGGDATFVAA